MPFTIDMSDLDKMLAHGVLQPHAALSPAAPNVAGPSAPASPAPPGDPGLPAPNPSESKAIGKLQYGAEKPQVMAPSLSPEYFQQREQKNQFEEAHPWGSPVSEHPGFLGKLGHGLAKAANLAGDILAPGTTALIPGTDLNRQMQTRQNETGFNAATQLETQKEGVEQKPEIAELTGELRGKQAAQTQAEEDRRADEANKTRRDIAAENNVTREDISKNKPGHLEHVSVEDPTKPGAAVMANYDPATGKYTDTSGKEIPNARPFEKTPPEPGNYLPVPDPQDPLHKIIGWVDPKSGHFRSLADIHMGNAPAPAGVGTVKPTGQEASREGQADVVTRAGTGLINSVQQNRTKMGNIGAILESAFLGTPLADPAQAGLAAEINSFAALQPAMHGFRGTDALKQFENLLGGVPNNPDALIASIKAMQKTAGYFNPNQGGGGNEAIELERGPDGKLKVKVK